MITAADVDTLLFDVIGTVVDEGGTMRAEVAAELEAARPGRAGAGRGAGGRVGGAVVVADG